jgi:hypothetical protein
MGNQDQGSSSYRIKITTQKPITILKSPGNSDTIPTNAVNLQWSATDPNGDPISYDVYVSEKKSLIDSLDPSTRIAENISGNEYQLTSLKNGGKYYWTVIPFDGKEFGECQSGVRNFIVYLPNPTVSLVLPMNGSTVKSTSVEFIWDTSYNGLEEVKYDLYLDTFSPPKLLESGINNSSYTFNSPVNGKTYYWYVVPYVSTLLGRINGQSVPSIMEFSVNENIKLPQVTLTEPKNNKILTDLTPTLVWTVSSEDDINLANTEYLILMDNSNPPTSSISTDPIKQTSITIPSSLEADKTYYWTVIPILGSSQGKCLSGVWSFRTASNVPEYNIELVLSDTKLKGQPGDTIKIDFTVNNLADNDDLVSIKLGESDFNASSIELNPDTFTLTKNSANSAQGTLSINIPKDIEYGTYEMTIIATSDNAAAYDIEISDSDTIIIIVTEASAGTDDELGLYVATIVLFIIIIILILLIMAKKKSPEPEQPDDHEHKDKNKDKKATRERPRRQRDHQTKETISQKKRASPSVKKAERSSLVKKK